MGSMSGVSGHVEGFEETVRDFWASRPRRSDDGRKLAGVAAAVGARYDIDPLLVRVAFVAMTVFGGIGLSFYLLGWLLFPAERDEVSGLESLLGRGRSSMSRAFALVLCVLLVPVTSWAFGGDWFDGGGFIGLALGVTALYLLHRSRGQYNRAVFATGEGGRPGSSGAAPGAAPPSEGPTRPARTTTTGSEDTVSTTPPGPAAAHPAGSTAAGAQGTPGFDPLGAAPLDWRLADARPAPT
ncbi:PspC domain-containing protein, partial [Saccharomonospora saliphila]|uniref:PspC domain-containing protein n=1 Tax=Saccharomonospora saliphila TaxID=369829 RepID=UPI0018DE1EAF